MQQESLSAADVFREIDTDGGGTVSARRISSRHCSLWFYFDRSEFRALMDVLDANGDGEIELDEFEEALENPELAAEQADEELAVAASSLQAIARGRNERKEFLRKKEKATKIQAQIRGRQSRNRQKKKHKSATKIQANIRGRAQRKNLKRVVQAKKMEIEMEAQ